jgi:hypothetical protein
VDHLSGRVPHQYRSAGFADQHGQGREVGSTPAGVIVGSSSRDSCCRHRGNALLADELIDIPVDGHGPGNDGHRDCGERDGHEH